MSGKNNKELTVKDEVDFKLKFANSELNLIKEHIAADSTKGEFALFIYDAQKRGLNPLKKQIYFVKYGGKPSHQVSIDGYRAIAEATGKYDGMSEVKFGDTTTYKELQVPEWAEVTVYRKGAAHGFPARVYFEEFVQVFQNKVGAQWAQRPRHMLTKCAEALALRKAFPEQLSGLYTTTEMGGDEDAPIVNVKEDTIVDQEEVQTPAKEPVATKAFEDADYEQMDKAPSQPNF